MARDLGAQVVNLTDKNVSDALIRFAQQESISHVVFGQSARSRWDILLRGSVLNRFLSEVRDVTVQGNDFEVANARPGFFAAVRFDQPDDEVDALLVPHAMGIVEHHVGLANAGCSTDVDAQLAWFLLLLQLELGHRSAHLDRMTDRFDGGNGKSEAESGAVTEAAFDSDLAAE